MRYINIRRVSRPFLAPWYLTRFFLQLGCRRRANRGVGGDKVGWQEGG